MSSLRWLPTMRALLWAGLPPTFTSALPRSRVTTLLPTSSFCQPILLCLTWGHARLLLCPPTPLPACCLLYPAHSLHSMQVNMDVECSFVKDMLRGDDVYEMRLKLLSSSTESYPFKDDD